MQRKEYIFEVYYFDCPMSNVQWGNYVALRIVNRNPRQNETIRVFLVQMQEWEWWYMMISNWML